MGGGLYENRSINFKECLSKRRSQYRSLDQLRPAYALSTGAVKQDGVAVGFPNGGQLHATGTMQAKENATGTAAADQHSFGNSKGTYLQFVLLANRVLDVTSEVVQVVNL
jgi:hypothetical protein